MLPASGPLTRPPRKSNLDTFLQRSSPCVPIHFHTQGNGASSSSSVAACEGVRKPRVLLEDVWTSLHEWSCNGVQVPLDIQNNVDSEVLHHFAPQLSAMQIFTKQPFTDKGDGDSTRSSVVGSDGAETKSANPNPNPNSDYKHPFMTPDYLGHLYFQFNETTRPHERAPLFDKMQELAGRHSGLNSLTSSDLTPYSWISIAWSPIYPIPSVKGLKDLNASFLTYHSLTPTFPETLVEVVNEIGQTSAPTVVLPPFASVTYKASGSLWIRPGTSDRQMVEQREESATSWVKTLDFKHDDLRFYTTSRYYGRPTHATDMLSFSPSFWKPRS